MDEMTNNSEEVSEDKGLDQSGEEVITSSEDTTDETGKDVSGKQPEQDLSEEEGTGFTDKVDPNKLPPELQKLYKGMQSDYTKKMQDIKGIQTKYVDMEQQAQVLQKLWADPEFQKWRAYETERRKGQAEPEPDFDSMTEDEKIQHYVNKAVKQTEEKMRGEFQQTYGTFITQQQQEKAAQVIATFQKAHPEAKEAELASLAPIIRQHGLGLEQAYVLKFPERFKQAAVDNARQELYAKKKANLETGHANQIAPEAPDKPSLDEALNLAKKEMGWQ